ncbi:MAG: hypothetical protein LBE08_02785 [Bifidobacteriaceae bacterium]|jgi:hypothetical protein|nr:hypothetical protein [Bifidobacteriaceae bacterium]
MAVNGGRAGLRWLRAVYVGGFLAAAAAFQVFSRDISAHLDEYNATEGYWTTTQVVSLTITALLTAVSVIALILVERRIRAARRPPASPPDRR